MGKRNFPYQMTHNEKIKDLLYFKGKDNNLSIKLESSKKIEIGDIFNIIVSITR